MGEPDKDFRLREIYSGCMNGAMLDIVARGCRFCRQERRPEVGYFFQSSRADYFLSTSAICEGFVALCVEFDTPEAAERAAAVYNDNTNYDPEFKQALRLTRPTPTTLELVVPQPDHHVCTRVLVTSGLMSGPEHTNPPKPHPLMSLRNYLNWNFETAGLKENIYLGRIMDNADRRDLFRGSSVPTWEVQEIPIEKCGQRWNPTGKSRNAGGWLISGACQFITNLDDPEKSTRPLDCTANGSVMMLSPELAGLQMTMNGLVRWGLRPQDIAFLRRNGIFGIPMWGCPRQIDMTTTHVRTHSTSLFGVAAQAVATLQEEEKDVGVGWLPRHVPNALAGAAGGWVRYDRGCGTPSDEMMPIEYGIEVDD